MVLDWNGDVLLPLYVILGLLQVLTPCHCQEWTWLAGDKITDKLSTPDYPGGRSGSSIWSFNGTVWMFGGNGFTDVGSGKSHLLSEMWSFDIGTKQFKLDNPGTWSSRSDPVQMYGGPGARQHAAMCGQFDQLFVFGGAGEDGVSLGDLCVYNTTSGGWVQCTPAESFPVEPVARSHSSVWCYGSSMYLFGGRNDRGDSFADMWKLNLSTLAWEQLHDGYDSKKVSCLSYPIGRTRATTWISGNTLYMFGGSTDSEFSYALQHPASLTSDLWRYHPKNNTWQFVIDVTPANQNSGYEIDEDATQCSSVPGGRVDAASWTDASGNLWLFGGSGVHCSDSEHNTSKLLSDVWRFDLDDQSWEFIGGTKSTEAAGSYGQLGKTAESNLPGARTEMMVWSDGGILIYIFGGLGHDEHHFGGYLNDLWSADLSSAISREYRISPAILLSFFGVGSSLLVAILVLGLYSRQKEDRQLKQGGRLEFRLIPEYNSLESDVT